MANLTQQIHQMVLYDLYELNPPDIPNSVFAFPKIYTKNVEAPLRKMNSNEIITHTLATSLFPYLHITFLLFTDHFTKTKQGTENTHLSLSDFRVSGARLG